MIVSLYYSGWNTPERCKNSYVNYRIHYQMHCYSLQRIWTPPPSPIHHVYQFKALQGWWLWKVLNSALYRYAQEVLYFSHITALMLRISTQKFMERILLKVSGIWGQNFDAHIIGKFRALVPPVRQDFTTSCRTLFLPSAEITWYSWVDIRAPKSRCLGSNSIYKVWKYRGFAGEVIT